MRLKALLTLFVVSFCVSPSFSGRLVPGTQDFREQDLIWEKAPRPVIPIPRVTEANLNGRISEAEKKACTRLTGFVDVGDPILPASPGTVVYLGWNDSGLYIAFENEEPDTANLFAQGLTGEAHLYWEDSDEIFLDPSGLFQTGYVFMLNFKGRKCDGFISQPIPSSLTHSYGFDRKWNGKWDVKTQVIEGKLWSSEIFLPWKEPFRHPKPGEHWGINLHRMRYASRRFSKGQTSSYSAICGPTMRLTRMMALLFTESTRVINDAFHRPYIGRNSLVLHLHTRRSSYRVIMNSLDGKSRTLAEGKLRVGPNEISYVISEEGKRAVSVQVLEGKRVIFSRTLFSRVPAMLRRAEALEARLSKLKNLAEPDSPLWKTISERISVVHKLVQSARAYLDKVSHQLQSFEERSKEWEDYFSRVIQLDSELGYWVWTKSPWLPSPRKELPRKLEPLDKLSITSAINEYESAVLIITNFTQEILDVLVSGFDKMPALKEVRAPLFSDVDTIVRNNPSAIGAQEIRGFSLPGKTGEPLLEITGDPIELVIPPLSSRLLWLTFLTDEMKPGRYNSSLLFEPLNKTFSPKRVRISLNVLGFDLPVRAELGVHCYNYHRSSEDMEDLLEHKVNHFFVDDFGSFRLKDGKFIHDLRSARKNIAVVMRYGKPAWAYGACNRFYEWAKKHRIPYPSQTFDRYWKEAVRSWAQMCKELGLDYKDYCVGVWDEVSGRNIEIALRMLRLAREVEPKMRWANTIMCSFEDMKRFAPYLDVWVFRWAGWAKNEFFRKLRKERGVELWVYSCATPVRSQNPLGYYRYFGWRAYANGLDGVTFFSRAYLIYRISGKLVTLRPWEAYREGIEDWQYLHLCQRLIEQVRKVSPEKAIKAKEEMKSAVADALSEGEFPPNTQEMYLLLSSVRQRIATLILRLQAFLRER